jgi:hypothetical protein
VQVLREGGNWVIRHQGRVVAEHAVLAGKAHLSVRHEHGPGAAARNARKRYGEPAELPMIARREADEGREVEVRDLAVYDRLVGSELVEAA